MKKRLLAKKTTSFLPKILALSDCIDVDEPHITFEITNILKNRYLQLPINILYDLAVSLANLVRNFILNNSDYSVLQKHVPTEFTKHWEITEILFQEILKNPKIKSIINVAKYKFVSFIKQSSHTALVGINPSHYYAEELIKFVQQSNDGVIIVCGMERDSSNKRVAQKALIESTSFINVPRETFTSNIQQCSFASRTEEAQAITLIARKTLSERQNIMIISLC